MKSTKINNFLNRFHVAMPKPRDQKERPSCIPQAVLETKVKKEMEKENKKLERDLEDETDLRKHYILANDEWKGDVMLEILDGCNVSDFFDPDILQRLEELEREEGLVPEQEVGEDCNMDGHELTAEKQEDLAKIRKKAYSANRIKKSTAESRPIVPRKFDKDKEFTVRENGKAVIRFGLDPTLAINRAGSRSRVRKRERSLDHMDMDVDQPNKKLRVRSMSCARSKSRPPSEVVPGEGFKDSAQKLKALKLAKKSVKKRNTDARRAPSPLIPFTVLIRVEEVLLI